MSLPKNSIYGGTTLEKKLPERKRTRMKYFDFGRNGAYFITICTQDRKQILSSIIKNSDRTNVGEGLSLPLLTDYGKILEHNIKLINEKYENVMITQYVIMPNHIHMILTIMNEYGRENPSPTVSTVVGWLKYQTTKEINSTCKCIDRKIFQRSFHDHIIRNSDDYDKISKYIYENPLIWEKDCFYSEE